MKSFEKKASRKSKTGSGKTEMEAFLKASSKIRRDKEKSRNQAPR